MLFEEGVALEMIDLKPSGTPSWQPAVAIANLGLVEALWPDFSLDFSPDLAFMASRGRVAS